MLVRAYGNEGLVVERLTKPGIHVPLCRWKVGHSIFARNKGLDALIPCICHIDSSIARDRNADWLIELAGVKAGASKFRDVFPVFIEDNDTFVPGIGNEYVSLRVHRYAARSPERAL